MFGKYGTAISILMILGATALIANGAQLFAVSISEPIYVCDEVWAELTPKSNEKSTLTLLCKHTIGKGRYSFSLRGGTYYSHNTPNYPNTGYSPYEIVSANIILPKYCQLTYSLGGQCVLANTITVENSDFTSYGRDYPTTFYGEDWRILSVGNETFDEIVDNVNIFQRFPTPSATGNWQDVYDGKTVFFVMEKEVPISIGKDTWVSLFYLAGVDTDGDGVREWLFPQCACRYQGIGNPVSESYKMDEGKYFHFGPCGTEMPSRDLDPVLGTYSFSWMGTTYSNVKDLGQEVEISRVILDSKSDSLDQHTITLEGSIDNSTWTSILSVTTAGIPKKDKEFDPTKTARYVRIKGVVNTYAGAGPHITDARGKYTIYALNPQYEKYYEHYEKYGCDFEAPELPPDDDQDDDGMKDDWEDENNIDDPDEDNDGDGVSNIDEYRQNSDPNDANDAPTPLNQATQINEPKEEFDIIKISIGVLILIAGLYLLYINRE